MLTTTVYLSRVIGVALLIVAAIMFGDRSLGVAAIEHVGQDQTALLLLGCVRATVGAAIVLIHNVWSRGFWPLIITLTGWAMLVRGVMNLFLPPEMMAGVFAAAHVIDLYYVYAAVPLVLGGYLALRGFTATPVEAAAGSAEQP